MERRGDLSPVLHTESLLQQEDPQLEVEVLPLEGVDPLAVLPHCPVEISSILIGRELQSVEIFSECCNPALLWHKEPAQYTQSTLLGHFFPFAAFLCASTHIA